MCLKIINIVFEQSNIMCCAGITPCRRRKQAFIIVIQRLSSNFERTTRCQKHFCPSFINPCASAEAFAFWPYVLASCKVIWVVRSALINVIPNRVRWMVRNTWIICFKQWLWIAIAIFDSWSDFAVDKPLSEKMQLLRPNSTQKQLYTCVKELISFLFDFLSL